MPGTGASVGGTVTSFAEVWIEILDNFYKMRVDRVTSFAEVWIEIRKTLAR